MTLRRITFTLTFLLVTLTPIVLAAQQQPQAATCPGVNQSLAAEDHPAASLSDLDVLLDGQQQMSTTPEVAPEDSLGWYYGFCATDCSPCRSAADCYYGGCYEMCP